MSQDPKFPAPYSYISSPPCLTEVRDALLDLGFDPTKDVRAWICLEPGALKFLKDKRKAQPMSFNWGGEVLRDLRLQGASSGAVGPSMSQWSEGFLVFWYSGYRKSLTL